MSKKIHQEHLELDADKNFEVVNLQNFYSFGCQVTSSNEATFETSLVLQVSNDLLNWIDVPSTTTTLTGDDVQIYDVTQSATAYVRVRLFDVTGTADIKIDYMLK